MAETDYAVAPGEFLREWIERENISEDTLARELDYTQDQVNGILCGNTRISNDAALRLQRATGISAHSWLRFEALYRADLARLSASPQTTKTDRTVTNPAPTHFILSVAWDVENMPPLVGPFDTESEAEEFAALNIPNGTFEVLPLARPYAQASAPTITIPAPHVPYGPEGVPEGEADALYLREAARRINEQRLFGPNLTATVVKLLADAADARAADVLTETKEA